MRIVDGQAGDFTQQEIQGAEILLKSLVAATKGGDVTGRPSDNDTTLLDGEFSLPLAFRVFCALVRKTAVAAARRRTHPRRS